MSNTTLPPAVAGPLEPSVGRPAEQRATLAADVARCAGYWADDELREGCDDCRRRTAGHAPGDRTVWMSQPLIVVFECEARIAP